MDLLRNNCCWPHRMEEYFLPIGSGEMSEGHKKLIDKTDSKVSEER